MCKLFKGHKNNLPLLATVLHHGSWKEHQRATTGARSVIPSWQASTYIHASLPTFFFLPFSPDGLLNMHAGNAIWSLTLTWTPCSHSPCKIGTRRRDTSRSWCRAPSKPLELGREDLEQPTRRTATHSKTRSQCRPLLSTATADVSHSSRRAAAAQLQVITEEQGSLLGFISVFQSSWSNCSSRSFKLSAARVKFEGDRLPSSKFHAQTEWAE